MEVYESIRPTAIGKKNWPFVGDAEAGEHSAIIYTVIESCRRRGLDPYAYLKDVLTRLPRMTYSAHWLRPWDSLTPLASREHRPAASNSLLMGVPTIMLNGTGCMLHSIGTIWRPETFLLNATASVTTI